MAFAAIGVGAMVPAAIMSIAAANLFTRGIYREYIRPDATAREETYVSKIVSLTVKFGALLVILLLNTQFAIDLQLIGGVVIMQTLPAVALGLYTNWFHRWALGAGIGAGLTGRHGDALPGAQVRRSRRAHRRAGALRRLGLAAGQPRRWTATPASTSGIVALAVNLLVVVDGSLPCSGTPACRTAGTTPANTTTSPTRATRRCGG